MVHTSLKSHILVFLLIEINMHKNGARIWRNNNYNNLHFLKNDSFGVRGTTEGISLKSCSQMGLLVIFVVPSLLSAVIFEFTSSS